MADTTIPRQTLAVLLDVPAAANIRVMERWQGEPTRPQPVHTVHGGAQLFNSTAAQKLGAVALHTLQEHARDAPAVAETIGIDR